MEEIKIYSLDELKGIVENCHGCPLSKSRTKTVFGDGNPKSSLMFIGEGPGHNEDKEGLTFVGKSGQLFNKILKAIGLERKDVYVANIVKCRPPGNRNPSEKEAKKCMEFLRWQVKIIQPKIIVCLGAVAARNIIDKDFRITQSRGKWYERGNYSIMATYHPAALLRDKSKKKNVWEDFKNIKKKYIECI